MSANHKTHFITHFDYAQCVVAKLPSSRKSGSSQESPFSKTGTRGGVPRTQPTTASGFESDYIGYPDRYRFAVELGRFVLAPFGGIKNRLIE